MDIEGLLKQFNVHKVQYVVIGASAFPVHGYARATLDVDICIKATKTNAERCLKALVKCGYDITDITIGSFLKKKTLFRQYLLEVDIHPYVKPAGDEPVISKDEVNAFLETNLLELIQADTVEQLVICGMQTHMCLEAAVRAAHDLGFSCLVASDACATRALQFEEHIITARSIHYSTLNTLQGSYARVLTTDAIIKELSQGKQ